MKQFTRSSQAWTEIHGARAYLVGAVKVSNKVFYEMTYDRDLAYGFQNRYKAREARELLGTKNLNGRTIWVSTAHHIS